MEFQINSEDFEYFYSMFPGSENLRYILHKYQNFNFCRRYLSTFVSRRFENIPTEEIKRIYDRFNLTENYDSFREEVLANDISVFLIGLSIPNKNDTLLKKKEYICELKKYFKHINNRKKSPKVVKIISEKNTVDSIPKQTKTNDTVVSRLLVLYSRNLKMQNALLNEPKDTRDYLLNIVSAIMKMEEPNNYPASNLWFEEVRRTEITRDFLDKFYKKATEKIALIELQIKQFRRLSKR